MRMDRQHVEELYAVHARSTPELQQADSVFTQQQGRVAGAEEMFAARAIAGDVLPRSLRIRAADVQSWLCSSR
jgi:hypothetical protein